MKILAIFLVLISLGAQQPTPRPNRSVAELQTAAKHFKNSGRYEIKYDKFADRTTVAFWRFPIAAKGGGGLFLGASFTFAGQSIATPIPIMTLKIQRAIRHETPPVREVLDLLTDGARLHVEADVETIDYNFGYVLVTASFDVPLDAVERLANSQSAEMRIAETDAVALKPEHQQMFKDMLTLARAE